jgi:C-terminal processing protease CtpA/Prc
LETEKVRRSISRDEAVATVEEAIGIVRKHAWHADMLGEDRLHDVRDMARKARIPEEVEGAVRYLLVGLNDRHSQLRTPQQAAEFREKSVSSAPPEVALRADGLAYVRIPAITGANEEAGRKVAEDLMSRISDLSKHGARGWIVDLRSCSGGNMWPMLAGLMPLLGDGVLGYFRARDGEQTPWRAGEHLGEPRLASPVDSSKTRVAVLIGPGTASSGEAVAVAFRGRPETRFFGQATYGVANSNQTFFLRDGSLLLLMTAIDVDRNGQSYGGKVVPDETSVGDNAEQAMQDAVRWLGQSTTGEHGVSSRSKR